MANLDLKPIVRVDINLSLKAAARKGFNLALIVGDSNVITTTERVRVYTQPAQLLTDGFSNASAEYKAALLYFSQHPEPDKLAVGVIDTGNGETWADALAACRAANSEWYVFIPLGATDSDVITLAPLVEAASPSSVMFYTTNTSDVLQPTYDESTPPERIDDVFMTLKANLYRRSMGYYCGTAGTDSAAAWAGVAMGLNSGTADSMFTMAYKSAVGITPDDLTETQVEYVAGSRSTTGNNGNVYIQRSEEYNLLQQGFMADKTSFDEVLGLDVLKNNIQLNVMDLLSHSRKIPYTEPGMVMIENVIAQACEASVTMGFIAPGKWTGDKCLKLTYGDYLPKGYIIQHEPVDDVQQAQKDNRIAPPIYVCCKLAGAIEYVTIEINVNR
jgi:hypothetical protein